VCNLRCWLDNAAAGPCRLGGKPQKKARHAELQESPLLDAPAHSPMDPPPHRGPGRPFPRPGQAHLPGGYAPSAAAYDKRGPGRPPGRCSPCRLLWLGSWEYQSSFEGPLVAMPGGLLAGGTSPCFKAMQTQPCALQRCSCCLCILAYLALQENSESTESSIEPHELDKLQGSSKVNELLAAAGTQRCRGLRRASAAPGGRRCA
jgi:hypothetical protein